MKNDHPTLSIKLTPTWYKRTIKIIITSRFLTLFNIKLLIRREIAEKWIEPTANILGTFNSRFCEVISKADSANSEKKNLCAINPIMNPFVSITANMNNEDSLSCIFEFFIKIQRSGIKVNRT